MLWTIFVILLVLWLLGFISGIGGGTSLIHLVLVLAVIVLIYNLVTGRRTLQKSIRPYDPVRTHAGPRRFSSLLESVRSLIEQRKHEVLLSLPAEPIWLQGDSTRLVILLNNVAKYTDKGGQIWIIVEQERGEVLGYGAGIAPKVLPRIFDLFTQADRTLDRYQGGRLRIGLSLVQKLVELHGGQSRLTIIARVGQ